MVIYLFFLVEALRPSQQFCSHVGTEFQGFKRIIVATSDNIINGLILEPNYKKRLTRQANQMKSLYLCRNL